MGASGFSDFQLGAFLNLYRIAHSELTVDKWDNSASWSPCPKEIDACHKTADWHIEDIS